MWKRPRSSSTRSMSASACPGASMKVAPSARTSSYSSSVASSLWAQFGSAHSQTNCVLSASKRSALAAIRSLTLRNSDSVCARLTLSSNVRLPSCRLPARQRATCLDGYARAVQEWPPQVERVAAVLRAQGVESRLEEFADGTPTAAAAAAAVRGDPPQIVKAAVFICDRPPVLAPLPRDPP